MEEMPQWCPAFMPAESNSDRPISEIVGAMVKGPMKRMTRPIRPENPTSTWNREPTMIEPWSCAEMTTDDKILALCNKDIIIYVVLI